MPAHSNAALTAYPKLACPVVKDYIGVLPGLGGRNSEIIFCAGNDSVFTFLQNVMDEIMELFPSRYIHIGGDEAQKTHWKKCPLCQARMKKEMCIRDRLNTTDLVMDETLEVTFEVTGTEEGKTMMNEDLSIKLSATTNRGAVEHLLFEGFPSEVIMKQGEKKKTVFIPVKKEGINKEYYVDISAFARGYRMAGAMQNIVVSAYHNSEVSLKNNIDKTVKEGQIDVYKRQL